VPVTTLREKHLGRVAHLHAAALAGDFLPSLGEPFLRAFYRAGLSQGLVSGYVWTEGGQPAGFVACSRDTSTLFRRILRTAAFKLARAGLPAMLRRPRLFLKAAETFLYPRREGAGGAAAIPAELLVIAVDERLRGRGVGEALVRALESDFCQAGITTYKVTVLQANAGANRFYQRLGFHLAGNFRLYGKDWNIYRRDLEAGRR
jgi:ribosomal protein S18 acetylase RimI-like enzyme